MKVSLIKQKGIKLSQTTALRGLVECWLSGATELARKKKRSEGIFFFVVEFGDGLGACQT